MTAPLDATAWQDSWDRQQEAYLPYREERLGYLVALAGAAATTPGAPYVLDLACGTGSITRRLREAMPGAPCVALDVDPVLLRIARTTFDADQEVSVVRADLRDPAWRAALPSDSTFDAVLTSTALHWLAEPVLRRLYSDLADLVRPGGVVANADHLPHEGVPELARLDRRTRGAGGGDAWERWWADVATDPTFAADLAERERLFPDQHPEELAAPAELHCAALLAGGFREAAVLWRHGGDGIVAAVR
ncbi:MAG: class I SAM-dependent methyltransferase [Mycobacteriales bacterium]